MPKRKNDSVWGAVQNEIEEWEHGHLDINPSFATTQKDIINLIDLYWMSKYRDTDLDSSGYKKAFFNIIMKPVDVASKMIDLDTKDIRVIAENDRSYYLAWFFEKELKNWMKNRKNQEGKVFGQFMNECVYKWPKYGHIVAKKTDGMVSLVPIQNIRNKPKAKNILSSPWMIEKHEYTPEELEDKNWDNVEKVIDKYRDEETGMITVYERTGIYEDISENRSKYNYFIIAEGSEDSEMLHYDTIDRRKVYKELKWDDIFGRAMGRGQAERLFENQIVKNQDIGLERAGLRWSSKHIFQTRDQNIAKNLFTDIENGELVIANSEITPIAVEERNLSFYNQSHQRWDANSADTTFSYEQMSGKRAPSGTTLGETILNTKMTGQYYELKQEEFGMFLRDILLEWVIPDFKKDKKNSHTLMMKELAEEQRADIVKKAAEVRLGDRGNPKAVENLASILKKQRELKIDKGDYEDLEYRIDVVITGEQIDLASKISTLQTVLQILGSNPTIMQDPRTKKIFLKTLDMAGISPIDLGMDQIDETEQPQAPAQMGGSIASPQAVKPIATMQKTSTVV